jgi:CRISPR-associated protein Cmr6
MSERGEVEFYNSGRGFGFIKREWKGKVHIGPDSFKGNPPSERDYVEFDVLKQSRGLHAKNLRIISRSSAVPKHIPYRLPQDTREIVRPDDIDNFALRLNKTPFFDDDEKFKFFKSDKNGTLKVPPDYSNLLIEAIAERHTRSIEKLNIKSEPIILKPEWRMVVGLGNVSVNETSMTLHHIYGIPYIPGSAIKGVVRSHIITEEFGKDEIKNAEERALKKQWFCDIFGYESRQGKIIFFDAFPRSNSVKIKPDVMNPHYSPYYSDSSGRVPPADYHNPKPIFFLTIVDTEFEFIIGIKGKDNNRILQGKFSGEYLLSIAQKWLKEALSKHGIGAKTAVGYGYMS